MVIKQLSVFVENRAGRLAEITEIIAANNINLKSLSIADTTNFGILRIIVDDPYEAERILKENSLTVSVTNVISVPVEDKAGGLAKILHLLAGKDIAVEYMYEYRPGSGKTYVIFRIEKESEAVGILKDAGYEENHGE